MANKANLGLRNTKASFSRAGANKAAGLFARTIRTVLVLLLAPVALIGCADEVPLARFKDIAAEAGIHFTHVNGAYGEKLLPETMGGGVAFFDFDNDGHQDLLFINSSYWPGHAPSGQPLPTMALYRNDGHGRLQRDTQTSNTKLNQ